MRLRELHKGLWAAYRGSDVSGRVRRFEGWTDRVSAEDAGDR